MPESCVNVTVTYKPKQPQKAPANAVDLHIEAVAPKGGKAGSLDLIGIDGVGPRDPKATFNVEGSGTGELDISNINVAQGGSLTVRVCSPSVKMPDLRATWSSGRDPQTKAPKLIPGSDVDLTFVSFDEEEPDDALVVRKDLEDVLEKISRLAAGALSGPLIEER